MSKIKTLASNLIKSSSTFYTSSTSSSLSTLSSFSPISQLSTNKYLSTKICYRIFFRKNKNSELIQMYKKMSYEQQEQIQKKQKFVDSQQQIDEKTKQTLNQYQQKIKEIRNHHNNLDKEIKIKYQKIMQQNNRNRQSMLKSMKGLKQMNIKMDMKMKMEMENDSKNINKSNKQLQTNQNDDDQYENIKQQIQDKRMDQLLQNQSVLNQKISQLAQQSRLNIHKSRKQFQLDYIKKYMLENVKQLNQTDLQKLKKNVQSQSSFIPNQLVLKKLAFKTKDGQNKQVLLAGVQQNDEDHCMYLKKLIEKYKIKDVLTMIPPDMPFFIKTENTYLKQWTQFLKRPSSSFKFYLNPNPKNLNDIKLTKDYISQVLQGMIKSKSFYQTTYSLMQLNDLSYKYQHQAVYSGLMSSTVQNTYFCDYPFLKQRQMIALNVKLQDLRQLIRRFTYYREQKKQNFSAELLMPKNVVEKKFRHIIKLAKTIALSSQSTPVIICDASIAEVLAQEWKKSPLQYLEYDYSQNSYFLDLDLNKAPQDEILFLQFIEKLVILDIILKPLVQKYFVKYQSFPFSCRNTLGGKQNLTKVFLIWNHYFKLYSGAIKGKFDKLMQSPGQEL